MFRRTACRCVREASRRSGSPPSRFEQVLDFLSKTKNTGIYRIYRGVQTYNEQLHVSYQATCCGITFATTAPLLYAQWQGFWNLTPYLVEKGLMSQDFYDRWVPQNCIIVFVGQLIVLGLWTEVTNYLRFPLFYYVLAPVWTKAGWFSSPTSTAATVLATVRTLSTQRDVKVVEAMAETYSNGGTTTSAEAVKEKIVPKLRKRRWTKATESATPSHSNVRDA
eukprot:PhM_4_TR14048/c0_g1_i1/m.6296